jgi:hypothetical protein
MRLRIHNPTNEHTKTYRDYNIFWDELTNELKKTHEVTENRYFSNSHFERYIVKFDSLTHPYGIPLMECEYLIENLDSGEFIIFSVSDDLTSGVLNEKHNPKLKKVFISQFIDYKIKHHVGDYYHKYSPWVYFPSINTDFEYFYNKRKELGNYIDKLYFRGSILDRPIINHFDKTILEGPSSINSNSYFEDLIKYSVGLSVAGVGELCYRDVEYLSLGLPFIRYEFQSEFLNPLIPNYHYISIPYDDTIPKHNEVHTDRLGGYKHSKMLESKFKEVINNKEFLSFIGGNGRKYYEDYLSPKSRLEITLKLINENL